MSKAEEEAIKRYPKMGLYDNLMKRKGFIEGYHQAEKDLELTWIDMMYIIDIGIDLFYRLPCPPKDIQSFYEEVLKRFKAQKGEEEYANE